MSRLTRTLAVLALVALAATIAVAVPAQAKTIDVRQGQSIQAAVDSAHPGDVIVVHPGTYRENVDVDKNDITLRGSGASSQGTVLLPPKNPPNGPLGGIGIRDDSKPGLVADNKAHGNCVGVIFLNTPSKGADQGWVATRNQLYHNDRACPGSKESPPISGVGVGLVGVRGVIVGANKVWGNHPSNKSAFKGGIWVGSSQSPKIAPS